MNELVQINNERPITTSRIIAEEFGKRHADVLNKIANLECTKEFTERNFTFSEYKDSTGRILPEYLITRDGFMFSAMGFTGKEAAKLREVFIKAFNDMEEALKNPINLPRNYKEALLALVEAENVKEKLLLENVEVKQDLEDANITIDSLLAQSLEITDRTFLNELVREIVRIRGESGIGEVYKSTYNHLYDTIRTRTHIDVALRKKNAKAKQKIDTIGENEWRKIVPVVISWFLENGGSKGFISSVFSARMLAF